MALPYMMDILDVDISKAIMRRAKAEKIIGEGDLYGDIIGVNVFSNGAAYNLSGCSCVGYFIRADGNTIVCPGAVSGNRAQVGLPQACYAYAGAFTFTLKISGTSFTGTVRIIDGVVADTTTQTIVDPGSVIPSLADYTALVQRAEAAAATINGISVASELITGTRYKLKVTKS